MKGQFQDDGIAVTIERDMIETTMGWTYTADPSWRYTDNAGHEHKYDHGYPTLDFIIDAEHWCEGDEGFARHDPHMAVDESHYECKQCRQVIEPGLVPPGTPQYVPGLTYCTLEVDGQMYDITMDEARAITEADDRRAVALEVAGRYLR